MSDLCEHDRDDRQEDDAVGPEAPGVAGSLAAVRVERRLRRDALDHAHDQLRVAVDVGADLEDRDAAVPTRQRDEIRLRHDARLLDRAPCEALVREDLAHLLGERRSVVVVKQQRRGHAAV